ncbi:bifunctional UDP-N-acetylglucosamine diphosphorylase/glucosamine-1-phosphate N-acetyltransferase GlmU [Candidatus Babeliales bacterium]|nr:bifunctional UDP-N-acetylglucosamine diphosphorylase/glucosamine-1-phosphate N-acetyltransferase GlmU [Candidatus Babeliales bacterium]
MAGNKKISSLQAIVLAAGTSSRFKTGRSKLVEKICGREMILYPTEILRNLDIPVLMVVGFQRDSIEETIRNNFYEGITFIHQEEQKGTGHAIQCTKDAWIADNILVMNGDMPLITADIIEKLEKKHSSTNAAISFVTAHHCDPNAMYGRVIQGNDNVQIIEAKEFDGDLSEQCCVNAGIYLIKKEFLTTYLSKLEQSSKTNEWYITDLIKMASDHKLGVSTLAVPFDKIRGVNDFKELWAAEQIKKSEIIQYWMSQGVRFSIAHNVQIDWDVTIGAGTFIGSGAQLLRGTHIGKDCYIDAFTLIRKTTIADRTTLHPHTIIDDSIIGSDVFVGPFASVHGHSQIKNGAVIGSFVEVNRSIVGVGSKAKHLTYLGDTIIGNSSNIGAGTIACNYDGAQKHTTTIHDNVFVGANNTLVAPVTLHNQSMTAAGSTITQDVPSEALGIARERQVNKEGYATKIKKEKQDAATQEEGSTRFFGATTTSKTSINEL